MSDLDFFGDDSGSKNPNISSKTSDNRDQVRVGSDAVKGTFSKRGLFNPGNRKRMMFFAASGFLLFSALVYTFMAASPQAVKGGDGDVARVYQRGATDGTADERVQESIRQYNEERLPEIQQKDPFAHPLLLTDREPEPEPEPEPVAPNPFVEEPVEVVEEVVEERKTEKRALSEEEVNRAMGILDKLVRAELEVPRTMQVAWRYEMARKPGQGQGDQDTDKPVAPEPDEEKQFCEYRRVRAGTTLFGTTDLALNSDVGGAVSVTVRSGPLNGYRLLGEFERKETWLRIVLTRLVAKDEVIPVNAIALDMDTTLNAVSGDVNRHIIYRYGWWGVGAFLKAMGKAAELAANREVVYADGGHVIQNTKTTTNEQMRIALGELGNDMGEEAKKRLNRPITVSLDRNEQIGIFVLDDICAQ